MPSFKRCFTAIGLALLGCIAASATPPLTVVQDILFNADGTKFNGTALISWPSFEASDLSNIPAHSISTQIVNGLLRVQLVPTMNALTPASYTVIYNSGGNVQFTEYWAVPPSNVPVRVRDIRIGGAGSIVGGGGGTVPSNLTSVNIADVIGLTAALNLRATIGTSFTLSRVALIDATGSLEGVTGSASDCLHVDGSSAPCSSGSAALPGLVFVDGEIPIGTVDGTNVTFNLGNPPNPVGSLSLYRNGVLSRSGVDFTLNSAQITFVSRAAPQANDILIASYRIGTNSAGYNFVDAETPAGTVDGSNSVFTLSQTPNPTASLAVFRNGLRLRASLDYAITSNQLAFLPGLAPQTGDVLFCSYRR